MGNKPVPANKQRTITQTLQVSQVPLPAPEDLRKYAEIVPDAPERFFKMAERQAEHRQGLERIAVGSNVKLEARGQLFAFLLSALAIIGGVVLIAMNKSVQGLAVIIADLAALAGIQPSQSQLG